jgi:D-alanine-D-alanine ligase-like ATP-grasp enzyme
VKLAVLNPSYEGSNSPFKGHDVLCDPSPWLPDHDWHRIPVHKATAVAQVRDLAQLGFDAFVNLCDGGFDEDRAGIEVVHALERYGCAFTGATSGFYEPTRDAMKRVCAAWDIDTADHVFARNDADITRAADHLRFPLIVKHENSYGSIGMGRDAKATDRAGLFAAARKCIAAYGAALIEEFVEGREFTVLVAENPADPRAPLTFTPVECRFPPGETFKHFDLKWVAFEGMSWFRVEDPVLADGLRDVSARMFRGCKGTGYGRCDLRMGADGRLVMLEINPNCGIFYPEFTWGSADKILSYDPRGHAFFVNHIVEVALARKRRQTKAFAIRKIPGAGWGMLAARALAAGERIQPGEEQPHVLASRAHVARTWQEPELGWFAAYAWPMTDAISVLWADDPDKWAPIDHSCDPNAWMSGLDMVARRPIAAGEAVTIDYATFCGDGMKPFDCRCGTALCRGRILGTDYRLPELAERYGDHVTDWVKRNRRP